MEGEANVGSIAALKDLEITLGRFYADTLQVLQSVEPEIRRKVAELDERYRQCKLTVIRLQIRLQGADEDEEYDISQQLSEAEEKLTNIIHWQKQVEECRQTYRLHADRLKEIANRDAAKAKSFLRERIDELNGYISIKVGAAAGGYDAAFASLPCSEPTGFPSPSSLPVCVGFERSNVMSNADVESFLSQAIPKAHRLPKDIMEICYFDQYRTKDNGYLLGRCAYFKPTGQTAIHLFRQSPDGSHDKEKMELTLAHEIGHHVYWNLLDRGSLRKWQRLFSESDSEDTSGLNGFISRKPPKDDNEDFAQSYAAYISGPLRSTILNYVNKRKYIFLRDSVFDGREY